MATLLAVAVAVFAALSLVSLLLYFDLRGRARAAEAWRAGADKRLAAQAGDIATLSRAVRSIAEGDPGGNARTRGQPRSHPIVGMSRPFKPSPAEVKGARTASELETARLPLPPVDTEGDRPALSETPEEIRARLEAEAEARSLARRDDAPPPSGRREALGDILAGLEGDATPTPVSEARTASPTGALPRVEGDDEPTQIHQRGRPTLRGGLEGVPLERPTSSATREAARRAALVESPTLPSAGVVRPPPPSGPRVLTLEELADLEAADLDRVDTLAEALGMTRDAALALCAERGVEHVEELRAQRTPPKKPGDEEQ